MGQRAEHLFRKLQTIEALKELIGASETSELECKQWLTWEKNRGGLVKAACGLANAEGGIIIIGMDARRGANESDVIQGFAFVADLATVAGKVRDILSDALEPGIRDVQVATVEEKEGSGSGCVVVYIKEEDGSPQRVKGGQFYVRMALGTQPMLYSQIADRFGRRPHAKLLVEPTELSFTQRHPTHTGARILNIFVRNVGRGSARFPALRCLKESGLYNYAGPYGNQPSRWEHFDDQTEWFSYRGSANDVLHPGEKISVGSLFQTGKVIGKPTKDAYGREEPSRHFYFAAVSLETSVICEGMPEYTQFFHWPELDHSPG